MAGPAARVLVDDYYDASRPHSLPLPRAYRSAEWMESETIEVNRAGDSVEYYAVAFSSPRAARLAFRAHGDYAGDHTFDRPWVPSGVAYSRVPGVRGRYIFKVTASVGYGAGTSRSKAGARVLAHYYAARVGKYAADLYAAVVAGKI